MNQTTNTYSLKMDSFIDNKNYKQIKNLILEIEDYAKITTLADDEKFQLHYILGNAWYKLFTKNKANKNIKISFSENNKVDQTIINYRKAKKYLNGNLQKESICNLYTNLGNIFSELGRPIEAFKNWNKALEYNSEFNMALGNLGYGLYCYTSLLYDTSHIHIINREAYRILNKIKKDNNYEKAYIFFESVKSKIFKIYPSDFLNKSFEDEEQYSIGNSENERNYKKWVLENKLFLNPLNDISTHTIVAHDVLSLPSIIVPVDMVYNKPTFHSLFNNIKQEFISLRYFYYLYHSMNESDLHFSDIGSHLSDTLDYPQIGIKFEYFKIAFRMAYSILDKIAYFLNFYLQLNIKLYDVSFKKIWYKNIKTQTVREEIINLSNNAINGLFILSKDFYEPDNNFKSSLDPESKNISDLRNYIEHRGISIHSDIIGDIEEKDINYDINEENFAKRTFYLIEKSREAIIYLSMAINIEEKKHNSTELVVPIIVPELDFDFS
jgi:hypothetical protein